MLKKYNLTRRKTIHRNFNKKYQLQTKAIQITKQQLKPDPGMIKKTVSYQIKPQNINAPFISVRRPSYIQIGGMI